MKKAKKDQAAEVVQADLHNPGVQALGQAVRVVQAPGQVAEFSTSDVPQELRSYLATAAGTTLGDVGSEQDAWNLVSVGAQMEAHGVILRGYALLRLNEILGKQKFSAGLAERNIARSTAYSGIDALRLFVRFWKAGAAPAFAQLGVTKAIALKAWSDEQIKHFAIGQPVNGLTFEIAAEMSTRELDEQQRQWKAEQDDQTQKLSAEVATLKTTVDRLENEKELLARSAHSLSTEVDLPMFARVVRGESGALTQEMSFCLDRLEAVADEHLFADVKHPERFKYQPTAAGTMFYAVAGIHARAEALLARIKEQFGTPETMKVAFTLTPAERVQFVAERDRLFAEQKAKAERRDVERENSTPGKRGAKRK